MATPETSLLLTLEEISRLVSHSGNPSETLTNIVQPHPAALRDRRLLGLPARARSVDAGAGGDDRACAPRASAASACGCSEGLAGLVGEQLQPQVVEDAHAHPRFKYFSEAGEDAVSLLPRRPDRRPRPAAGRAGACRRSSRAAFDERRRGMLTTAGAQLAPIVSEARTLGQFVAPAHQRLSALAQNLWWSWDDERPACSAISIRCCGASSRHNPIALLQRIPIERLEERASQLGLHSRINHAYRRMQEYLAPRTPGARATPACSGRGRSRISRPSSACTSRCRSTRAASASSPAITSRRRPIWASRSSASASTTTRAISGSGSIATAASRRTTSTSTARVLPIRAARRRRTAAGARHHRHAHRHRSRRASGSWPSAATCCCCSTPTSRATSPRIAS